MKRLGKKAMAIILCICMGITMLGTVTFADEGTAPEEAELSGDTDTVVIDNDGDTEITDAAYDKYFDGTAAEGVAALLNAGKCYINNVQIPAEEPEAKTPYQINWVNSLYYTEGSGWGYNVHKTTSENTLTFAKAREGMFVTTSTVRGHKTTIYLDAQGKATAINIESYEVVRIANIEEWGHDRVIERGEFDLETNRVRYDVNEIHFPTEYFDEEAAVGDVAVYWYGNTEPGDGSLAKWHLTKATAKVGVVTNPEKGVYAIGDWSCKESNVSRYNLIDCARPTQGYTTYTTLGLTAEKIVLWCTPNGMPIGFTYGTTQSESRTFAKKGVANAEAYVATIKESTDGSDIATTDKWAAKADIDTFKDAIAAAKTVANANASTMMQLDWASYQLSLAWKTFTQAVADGERNVLEDGVYEWENDGTTQLDDSSFDKYFEGTAAEGIEALMDAGKVSINGIPVPADETTELYQINKTDSLYKKSTGWGYNVHKTTSAETLSFKEARSGMVLTSSTVRGHKTYITVEDGVATAINIESYEVVKLTGFTKGATTVTDLDRGDFELETKRVRYDINGAEVPVANFDSEIEPGDVVCFWYSTDGWHAVKAGSKIGVVTNPDKGTYAIGEWSCKESNVSRYNLVDDTRPTQGYTAYTVTGLQDDGIEIILWLTPNGMPIGFSYGDNAKAAIDAAVQNAKEYKATIKTSADGEKVKTTEKWATAEAITAFDQAIETAENVSKALGAQSWTYEKAIYALSQAWQTFDTEIADGLLETGEKKIDNDGSTMITDAVYDKYFDTTAAEGVEALMDAGKVSINGIPVPKDDTTELYQINMTDSLYKKSTGWGYNVHKTTSAETLTFKEARSGLVNTSSTVRGHQTILMLDDNGKCTSINIESFEVMKITYFEDHGGNVDQINRGTFDLETNRVRFDANKITGISSAEGNFGSDIEFGDVVYFWYGKDSDDSVYVWHMYKAGSKTGVVTSPSKGVYALGDWSSNESNVSRYNLIDDSRPTQGYTAYTRLGLQDAGIEITLWNTANGMPIGFSYGANAKKALQTAIENAEDLLESVVTSTDGTDVASDKLWAAESDKTTFKEAIDAAKVYLGNTYNSSSWERDKAIYALSLAWGDETSGFIAATANGELAPEAKEIDVVEVAAGQKVKLNVANADSIEWKSDDEKIATVSKSGLVKGIGYGITTVTAVTAEDEYEFKVRVLFSDVAGTNVKGEADYQYFMNPVCWAADNGITKGYEGGAYFGVGRGCTRRELVIFLWRVAGSPVETSYIDPTSKFTDLGKLSTSTDTYKAISWAVSEGIINGYADKTFHPSDTVTRKDALLMIYKMAGKPEVTGKLSYSDVAGNGISEGSNTYKAILWAEKNGITYGYSDGTFRPLAECLREQIVTFLYRYNNIKN